MSQMILASDTIGLGIVYVLTNQAMPDIVKIGCTSKDDIRYRLKELDNTAVPLPFECYCAYVIPHHNMRKVEQALHHAFGDYRMRKNREFFKDISPDRVESILSLLGEPFKTNLQTKEEEKEIQEFASRKKERLTFEMLDIPVGSTLFFTKNPSVTCQTVDARNCVVFIGKGDETRHSLSSAASKALQDEGYEGTSFQGGLYWMYSSTGISEDAQTLVEMRRKMEEGSGGGE